MGIKDRLYLGKTCKSEAILALVRSSELDRIADSEEILYARGRNTKKTIQLLTEYPRYSNHSLSKWTDVSLPVLIDSFYEVYNGYRASVQKFVEGRNYPLSLSLKLDRLLDLLNRDAIFKEEIVFLHALYLCKVLGKESIDKEQFEMRLEMFSFQQYADVFPYDISNLWNEIHQDLENLNEDSKTTWEEIIVLMENWKMFQWIEKNVFLKKVVALEVEIVENKLK